MIEPIDRALRSAIKDFKANVSRRPELMNDTHNGIVFTNLSRVTDRDDDIMIAVTMIDLKKAKIGADGLTVEWTKPEWT